MKHFLCIKASIPLNITPEVAAKLMQLKGQESDPDADPDAMRQEIWRILEDAFYADAPINAVGDIFSATLRGISDVATDRALTVSTELYP